MEDSIQGLLIEAGELYPWREQCFRIRLQEELADWI